MAGASEEDGGGWRPDYAVSNTDKETWPHRINTDEDCLNIAKRKE